MKMEQKTIICDACGKEIDYANTDSTRTIAKDAENRDVIEQFFTCQNCGAHYTIMVIDNKMKIMIQKRKQLQKQIKLHQSIKSGENAFRKIMRKDETLKRQQKEYQKILKEKYRDECSQ